MHRSIRAKTKLVVVLDFSYCQWLESCVGYNCFRFVLVSSFRNDDNSVSQNTRGIAVLLRPLVKHTGQALSPRALAVPSTQEIS